MAELPWDRYGAKPTERVGPVPEATPTPAPVSPPPAPSLPAPPPPVAASDTPDATDMVKADAKSRSKRTLVQGLIFDIFAAIVASVALLSGADPFVKETWVGFGILLIKSVVSAIISYFMRMRKAPTIRTKGEKYAIAPVPRPVLDNERNAA